MESIKVDAMKRVGAPAIVRDVDVKDVVGSEISWRWKASTLYYRTYCPEMP